MPVPRDQWLELVTLSLLHQSTMSSPFTMKFRQQLLYAQMKTRYANVV